MDKNKFIICCPILHPHAVHYPDMQDICEDEDQEGVNAEVLAVVELCSLVGDPSPDSEYLSYALQIAGASIANMLISHEKDIWRRTGEALLCITQIAPLRMDLLDLVEKITDAAQYMTNTQSVYIYFVDDYSKEIWLANSNSSESLGARIPFGKGICGLSALTGQIMNIPDCRLDPMFDSTLEQHQGEQVTSMICVPIPPPVPCGESFSDSGSRKNSIRLARCSSLHNLFPPSDTDVGSQMKVPSISLRGNFSSTKSPKSFREDGRRRPASDMSLINTIKGCKLDQISISAAETEPPVCNCLSDGNLKRANGRGASDFVRPHVALTAILKLVNKRGGESFDEVDEDTLALFCAEVNNLLVPRAVEANLIKRSMSERKANLFTGGYVNMGGRLGNDTLRTLEASYFREFSSSSDDTNRCRVRDWGSITEYGSMSENPNHVRKRNEKWRNLGVISTNTCGDVVLASHQMRDHSLYRMYRLESAAFKEKVSQLHNWGFNPFKEDIARKCTMIENMFQYLDFEKHMGVDSSVLQLWVQRVLELYRPNPFHNFNHAFSVMHVTWMVVKEVGLSDSFSPLELIACLIASYCHDIDHPGNNNVFEIQSGSNLALMYSDDAVLERHHIHITFRLLREDGGAANIFKGLTHSCYQEVRKIVVRCILATDMSQHVSHCSRLRKFVAKYCGTSGSRWVDRDTVLGPGRHRWSIFTTPRNSNYKSGKRSSGTVAGTSGLHTIPVSLPGSATAALRGNTQSDETIVKQYEDHMFLLETIIHCADLSGQVLVTHLALEWGRRVLQEFKNQAVLEESLELPITFLQESNEVEIMKGQAFFITSIVQPLWEPFVDIFPELNHRIIQMHKNVEYYKNAIQHATG